MFESMRSTVILLNNLAFVTLSFGAPFLYGVRTGKDRNTVLAAWGLFVFWGFIQAFVLIPWSDRYDPSLADVFSDGPAVTAALMGGWIWGLFVMVLAGLSRAAVARFWPSAFRRLCLTPIPTTRDSRETSAILASAAKKFDPGAPSRKRRLPLLLCCLFLGFLGVHRFYAGRVATGVLFTLLFMTAGNDDRVELILVAWLGLDLLLIVFGKFTDGKHRPIEKWK